MSVPITAAQLSGNFCETLVYGMYLVTCGFCARTLLLTGEGQEERWVRLHEIRWIMASVAIALFIICTFDVAIGLLHNFHAFVKAEDATAEFNNIADWINIARSIDQILTMIIGDFVLIYRCWIVYGRRWIVITPSLLLYLAAIAMAIKTIQIECDPATLKTITLNSNEIRPWYSALFAINVVQNILTTGILIWRIWRVERSTEKYCMSYTGSTINRPRHLLKVMRVIAESGAAYTLTVVATFLVIVIGSNALYPVSDIALQATGVAFNVILVRSSTRRDRTFTMFDNNERNTTIMFQHTDATGETTLGEINVAPRQDNGPRNVELGAKSTHTLGRSSESDIQFNGITVTKTVVRS